MDSIISRVLTLCKSQGLEANSILVYRTFFQNNQDLECLLVSVIVSRLEALNQVNILLEASKPTLESLGERLARLESKFIERNPHPLQRIPRATQQGDQNAGSNLISINSDPPTMMAVRLAIIDHQKLQPLKWDDVMWVVTCGDDGLLSAASRYCNILCSQLGQDRPDREDLPSILHTLHEIWIRLDERAKINTYSPWVQQRVRAPPPPPPPAQSYAASDNDSGEEEEEEEREKKNEKEGEDWESVTAEEARCP
ncbi:hypothetical protein B0J13DRAFT_569285 [Dactylonectria estremocensis]|uniref:Uncharacterized protein n=1 Tax=Dactylonectria estremocensis TaxID=1079267 RepID=A0A9P9DIA6_9HYPO|nr:hypothetical protein B0J13DRAFT_569285 [Dactylonectria estremocensis]